MASPRKIVALCKQLAAKRGCELWWDRWTQHWVLQHIETQVSVDAGYTIESVFGFKRSLYHLNCEVAKYRGDHDSLFDAAMGASL